MKGVLRTFAVLLQATIVFAQAQSSAPPVPAGQPANPTLRVTTRLVQINVLVHDHHGNPVADLKKDDFELSDAGKRQTISFLAVDTLQPVHAADTNKNSVAVMPSNMATNRPSGQGNSPSSVTVLLLDLYNTKMTDQMYAKRQVIKFLHQIRPEDRIAIYLLKGNGFSVVHDFTNSSESLLASIVKVLPGFSHELDGSEPDASNTGNDDADSFIDTSNTVMANFFLRNRALNTCLSFKTLAQHLSGVPGRKNVVWVSGGFPIDFGYGDPQDGANQSSQMPTSAMAQDREIFADYIESASQAMNDANVAVYPVDARGLLGLPMADASKNFKLDPRTHQLPASAMRVDHRNMDTMSYIADLTGGKAFYNTNDLENAIRKAIDDSAVTYTIGYYVSGDNWDNKYHKIKVKVLRSGMSVRTKKGYLAAEPKLLTPTKLDQTLREAIWSPLDSTAIEITARIDPSPALPNASRLYFAVDPAQLTFNPDNDKMKDSIDVLFVQQTKQGKQLVNVKQTLVLNVTQEQLAVLKTKGITTGKDVEINAQTQAVRIVVLDRGSGLAGSVTLPVGPGAKSGATVAAAPAPSAN